MTSIYKIQLVELDWGVHLRTIEFTQLTYSQLQLKVVRCEVPIKSIELQLIRVETCGCAEGYAKDGGTTLFDFIHCFNSVCYGSTSINSKCSLQYQPMFPLPIKILQE